MRPVLFLLIAAAMLAADHAATAQQPQRPPQQQAAPKVAPPKPYKPVALKLPTPMNDASLRSVPQAARRSRAEEGSRRARQAVVAQGFFWEGENGDKADKKKSGADNLAAALGLADKDSDGWDILMGYAADPTDDALPRETGRDLRAGRSRLRGKGSRRGRQGDADRSRRLGLPGRGRRRGPRHAAAEGAGVRKARPAFRARDARPGPRRRRRTRRRCSRSSRRPARSVMSPGEAVAPLGNDQLCYIKDGADWKITGFIGGEQ